MMMPRKEEIKSMPTQKLLDLQAKCKNTRIVAWLQYHINKRAESLAG
jgi:hypothetical protein